MRPGKCTRTAAAPGFLQLAFHPPLAFLRNYLLRGGIRDGVAGLVISVMNSYYVFLKFAKLWELSSTGSGFSEDHEGTTNRNRHELVNLVPS